MNIRKRLRKHPEMHSSALNDILFILLLFFLIVSTLANPNLVKVNNPKGKSDSKAKQSLVVSVDKDNRIFIGQKEVSEFELDTTIKLEVNKLKAFIDTPTVVINADTSSLTGNFFKVGNAAKAAGAKVAAHVKQ
jgi:biopolymer transport protein ExbD